jgi:hypothetical protein
MIAFAAADGWGKVVLFWCAFREREVVVETGVSSGPHLPAIGFYSLSFTPFFFFHFFLFFLECLITFRQRFLKGFFTFPDSDTLKMEKVSSLHSHTYKKMTDISL